jgi:mono/diheme cytochrome c family protein
MSPRPTAVTLLALLILPLGPPAVAAEPPATEGAAFFEARVRPILQSRCLTCHGGAKVKSGLSLTSREALLKGGDRGPAVSLDDPESSLLLQAVNRRDLEMPPKGKLAQSEIDVLARWVKMGAPWGSGSVVHGPPRVDERARAFWSFRPVVRPEVPAVKQAGWARTPVDAFILEALEAAGLRPAPPAGKTTLLRRVTYDLIGLPPTPEEVDAFLADGSPDAYEKVVDRLLASSHYGERWARHWLDLVRYAETNGYEFDAPKPQAWRYRDYVIRSLNDDKPYDRFAREQLAGDELEPASDDALIATGYYRLGPWDGGAPDRLQATFDELDDVVATTGQVFLGLTVHCARCHNHKSDPFPQADYYRLLAFFRGVRRYGPRGSLRPIAEAPGGPDSAAVRTELGSLAARVKAVEDALLPHLEGDERDDFAYEPSRPEIVRKHVPRHVSQEDFDRYREALRRRSALERTRPQALCVAEDGPRPAETYVLARGNPRSPGARVEPGFPSVIDPGTPPLPTTAPGARSSGRRLVLADWIASPDNPLTARVMVNRVWQHHFGRGIVRSPSDFGYRGAPPTQPELLDWLAAEFVARGWSLKALHRLVVTSNVYRTSSRADEAMTARDPENDLFGRFDLRRLEAEEVRDSVLAVCGDLNRGVLGGPSVYPHIQREVLGGQSRPGSGWGLSTPGEQARRSVYAHVKRSLAVPLLATFDAPDTDESCPARFATTQPTQALGLLNGEFINERARAFAGDVRLRAGDDPAAQVRLVLRRVTQREPSGREVGRGVAFLARMRDAHRLDPPAALARFCLLALNLNEFVYLD